MDVKGVVKEHGFTLVQVAEKLGITKGGLSQSINGNPTVETLRSIAEVIGCQVGDFFRDEATTQVFPEPKLKCPYCGKPLEINVTKQHGA
jgi:transcriptional regulator with XRE-family HTH domain